MITYVTRMKRREVDELSNLPFEEKESGAFQNEVGF
jgi:hypothetical protein